MSYLSDLHWAWKWHEVVIFNLNLSTLHIQQVKMWISQHQQVLRYALASSKTLNTKYHFQLEFEKADSEKPERETFCRHLTLSVLLFFVFCFFSPWKFHIWYLTLLCKMALSWSNRNSVCATADFFWRQVWLQEAGVFVFLNYFRRIRRNLFFKRGHLWPEY